MSIQSSSQSEFTSGSSKTSSSNVTHSSVQSNKPEKDDGFNPIDMECNIQTDRITKSLDKMVYQIKLGLCIPTLIRSNVLANILTQQHLDDVIYIMDQYDSSLYSQSMMNMAAMDDMQAGDMSMKHRVHPDLCYVMYILANYPELKPHVERITKKIKNDMEIANIKELENPCSIQNLYVGWKFLQKLEQFCHLMVVQMKTTAAEEFSEIIHTRKLEKSNHECLAKIAEDTQYLKEEKAEHDRDMHIKSKLIAKLRQELGISDHKAIMKRKKQILDSERQMVLATRAHTVKYQMLQEEEIESREVYMSALRHSLMTEKTLRDRRRKCETQLQSWLQKYDVEMSGKQEELDDLNKQYEEEVEKGEELTNKKHKSRIRARRERRKLGSRDYKNYTDEMMQLACEAVASNQITSRDAERQFGIPRRTIINKLKQKHTRDIGHPTTLSAEEEKGIVRVLQASSDFGYPLTKVDLKLLVHEYLKKNSRENLFKNQMPGDGWVQGFLARHANELSMRSTQNISKSRAETGPEEITKYFENLSLSLEDVPAENIINFDETNLSDDPGSSKGIFRRGVKYPERIANSSKGNISLMFTATASGQSLPLYVVYKASNLYSEWISGGPPNTRYNCTKSGWFDSPTFEDYFDKIIIPWAQGIPGTKVVICDNLSSHLSMKVVELCDQYEIKFVFIPPRSTHLTQPLDVAFFAPVKKAWRQILYNYKHKNPNQTSLNKKHFPKLLVELSEAIKINKENNLKSGFKATGIFPLNPQEVLKKLPEMQETIMQYGIDQALLHYLKETRSPNPMAVKRNKKVHCEPGKSITISDFNVNSKADVQAKTKKTQLKIKKSKIPKINTNSDYTTLLDAQTGLFVDIDINDGTDEIENLFLKETFDVFDDTTYFDEDIEADAENITENFILGSPESLSRSCINVINSYMSQYANNETLLLAHDHEYADVKVSNSDNTHQFVTMYNNKKPVEAGPSKITIQSYKILKPPKSHDVSFLNKVSNAVENTPFTAISENDLPECLKYKKNKSDLNEKSTVSRWKHINLQDKLEVGEKRKLPLIKHVTANQEKTRFTESNPTTSGFSSKGKPKKGTLKKIKLEVTETKPKNYDRKDKKNKKSVGRKKIPQASAKRRPKRYDSKSSSISADSTTELITADSDNSDYASLQDYYMAECLREQEDKENFELNDIPFGMHDIEYFTPGNKKLQEGSWVVARFATKKSMKHFVGKVLSVSNDLPKVKFLRKVKESKCKEGTMFTYPAIDDICTIPHLQDIMTVLPDPKIKLQEQDKEFEPLMAEREKEYHEEMTAKLNAFIIEHAARVIQTAWRDTLRNRAEKKKLNKLRKKIEAEKEAAAKKAELEARKAAAAAKRQAAKEKAERKAAAKQAKLEARAAKAAAADAPKEK